MLFSAISFIFSRFFLWMLKLIHFVSQFLVSTFFTNLICTQIWIKGWDTLTKLSNPRHPQKAISWTALSLRDPGMGQILFTERRFSGTQKSRLTWRRQGPQSQGWFWADLSLCRSVDEVDSPGACGHSSPCLLWTASLSSDLSANRFLTLSKENS